MEKTILHPLQAEILRVLVFRPNARFSDLNVRNISSDHFTFHIKQLVERRVIEKTPAGRYRLTATGKEFAGRLDTDNHQLNLERQAKIGALVGCVLGTGSKRKYLLQQRLKEPYYGFWGFMTGKVRWGETIPEAATRELKEETGLTAQLRIVGLQHKMDYAPDGLLLEDKYFYVLRGDDPQGTLIERFEGGKNVWLSKQGVAKLPDLFHGVETTVAMLDQNRLAFHEAKYTIARY